MVKLNSMEVKIKRVYEEPGASDGTRVLIDRLWPRGLSKRKANVEFWLKEIAPSDDLRKWFGHDPNKWEEFKKRYYEELKEKKIELLKLKELQERGNLTLVYGARDEKHNNAIALQAYLSDF